MRSQFLEWSKCLRRPAGRFALTLLLGLTTLGWLACSNQEPAPGTGAETVCGKEIIIDVQTKVGTLFCLVKGGDATVKNLLPCDLKFHLPHLDYEVPVSRQNSASMLIPAPGEYHYTVEASCVSPQLSGMLEVESPGP